MKYFLRTVTVLFVVLIAAYFIFKQDDIPLQTLKEKYFTSASKFVTVDGMQVHYRVEGEGRPFVLIHGTGASLQTWDVWTDTLQKYYKVIRLDMPGFGLTGPRADKNYSSAMYVEFLHKFLLQLQADTIILAGNSLGGEIAWNYAAAYPSEVTHLILVDPAGFYASKKQNPFSVFALAKHKWLANLMSQMDTKILVKQTLKDVYYDDSKITPERIELYHDMSLRAGNRAAFSDRVQQIDRERKPDLSPIKAKTLLMWGTEDKLLDISLAKNFESIHSITKIEYTKTGHSPQEEIPERSVTDAMNFIMNN